MKTKGLSKTHLLFLLYPSVFLAPFGGLTVLALILPLERYFTDEPWFIPASIAMYMIPFAFFQLFSGALSDIYGRKRIILFGLFTYSLASLLCVNKYLILVGYYAFLYFITATIYGEIAHVSNRPDR